MKHVILAQLILKSCRRSVVFSQATVLYHSRYIAENFIHRVQYAGQITFTCFLQNIMMCTPKRRQLVLRNDHVLHGGSQFSIIWKEDSSTVTSSSIIILSTYIFVIEFYTG